MRRVRPGEACFQTVWVMIVEIILHGLSAVCGGVSAHTTLLNRTLPGPAREARRLTVTHAHMQAWPRKACVR